MLRRLELVAVATLAAAAQLAVGAQVARVPVVHTSEEQHTVAVALPGT